MAIYVSFWNRKGKLEPVGDGGDKRHLGWFDVEAASFPSSRTRLLGVSSGIDERTLSIAVPMTKKSYGIRDLAVRGTATHLVTVHFTNEYGAYWIIDLSTVFVSSFDYTPSRGVANLSLDYDSISTTYKEPARTGTAGS